MSDLSATDGVAHVVADLIPNTDLGSDLNQIQTPFFDLIKDGGIKSPQNTFDGTRFNFNGGIQTVKSVGDSTPRRLGNSNNNVPEIPRLYQTPVQDSFIPAHTLTQESVGPVISNQQYPNEEISNYGVSGSSATSNEGIGINIDHDLPSIQDDLPDYSLIAGGGVDINEGFDLVLVDNEEDISDFDYNNFINENNVLISTVNPIDSTSVNDLSITEISAGIQALENANFFPPIGVPLPAVSETPLVALVGGSDVQSLSSERPRPPSANVPSLLTLYSAPNLSPEERRDPFSSGVNFQSQSVIEKNIGGNSIQKALLDKLPIDDTTQKSNSFITFPKKSNQVNPFDLSSKFSDFDRFNTNLEDSSTTDLPPVIEHDSFFVITRGDINLQEIINQLDDEIRRDIIHIVDTPAFIFNDSTTRLALEKSLPSSMITQIEETFSKNGNLESKPIFVHVPEFDLVNQSQLEVPTNDFKLNERTNLLHSLTTQFPEDQTVEVTTDFPTDFTTINNINDDETSSPPTRSIVPLQQTTPKPTKLEELQIKNKLNKLSLTEKQQLMKDSVMQDLLSLLSNETDEFALDRNISIMIISRKDKNLEPITGMMNLKQLKSDFSPLDEARFPIVIVSPNMSLVNSSIDQNEIGSPIADIIDSLNMISNDMKLNFTSSNDIGKQINSQVGKELPKLSQLIRNPAKKRIIEHLLQEDVQFSTSEEQELNVIEFLRKENLTAYADMLEDTGLNRDMLRGGLSVFHKIFIK